MVARYGQSDVKVEIDITDGGALQDLTQDCMSIAGVDLELITQESDTFGDAWVEALFVGVRRLAPLQLVFFYDDTASTGTAAVLDNSASDDPRSFAITFGGSKKISGEAWLQHFKVLPKRHEMTMIECTLLPTGTIVSA